MFLSLSGAIFLVHSANRDEMILQRRVAIESSQSLGSQQLTQPNDDIRRDERQNSTREEME